MTGCRRNILFIQGVTRMGGSIRGLLNFLERMDRQRFSPMVATSANGEFTSELKLREVPYLVVPMGMWRKAKSWPKIPFSLLSLRRIIIRTPIHLVHANTLWDNPYAIGSAWRLGIPIICHIRGSWTPDKIQKYRIHRATRIVTVSRALMAGFIPTLIPRVRVVYDGVDLERFRPRPGGHSVREELGIGKDRLVVGMISRLDPLKGQDTLIRAMAVMQKGFPNITLLLAGETSRQDRWYRACLEELAQELCPAGTVIFTGFRGDIDRITNAIDVAVLPSREEGFGLALVEAMSAGKPVVATTVGGIPEVVEDGVTGLLVPPENTSALAEALKTLLSDSTLRIAMGKAGKQRAERLFDVKTHVESMQNLYQELIPA
ncbi:MAG: glycosyltransferase family 4 protein [Deltaproteobacteria bacterium]|nr:glycosyltransferase family 4 protein [Deltaproteobacteria bacterium]